MADDLDLEQLLDTAVARHEAGQLNLAEADYRLVLQYDPNALDALNLLGAILQERGGFDESIPLLRRALEIEPDFPEALISLARAERAVGSNVAAAAAARRAVALAPELAAAHFQLGGALIELADHGGAVEALRRATTLEPQSVDALLLLGIALTRINELQAATDALLAALALDPGRVDAAPALVHLAYAYHVGGNANAAIKAARRAVSLDPTLPEAQVQLGRLLLDLENDEETAEVLRRAIEMAPRSLEAQIAFATVSTRLKDFDSAAQAWKAALALKPDDTDLLIDLARSLDKLECFDEASNAYHRADQLAHGHPIAQFGIANGLARKGDFGAAVTMCRRALETRPAWSRVWLKLGNWESMLGNFVEAEEAYRHTLALDPGSAAALKGLSALGKRLDTYLSDDIAKAILVDQSRPLPDRIAAGFALGRMLDREHSYDEAFEAFVLANRLAHSDRAARKFAFDRSKVREMVNWLIATFVPQTFVETAGWGDPSDLPVFVVGMPRSGTSLVEQIVASHPLIFGAGERKNVTDILTVLGNGKQMCSPMMWDRELVRRESKAYVDFLAGLGGSAVRVIDKMPFNAIFLAQIAILFPHARVVICRRDLRDVGLSCFFQHFYEDSMMWADDLGDCGFQGQQIGRLMDYWVSVLPVPVLQMQYETLVGNLERESRRLIDFLRLDWNPACLAFHKTNRVVATASHWQVRQPLYASSIGRWQHYRRHLDPLLRELEGLLPIGTEHHIFTD